MSWIFSPKFTTTGWNEGGEEASIFQSYGRKRIFVISQSAAWSLFITEMSQIESFKNSYNIFDWNVIRQNGNPIRLFETTN